MAQGKLAAYQRLRPLEGDITNDLLNAEDQEFKHRAEQREIEDRKARAKADKDRKAKEGIARAKGLKLYDTGSDTLNETLAEAITIATNEYPKIFEILDDDTGKYSQQDKIKAKLRYDNILNAPENLRTLTNSVMGEFQEYQKGVENGTLFRDEEYEKKFQDGFKGVSLSYDNDMLPVAVFRKGQQDLNNDGVINYLDVETMGSLNDAYSRPTFQKKFNYDSLVKQHAEKLESAVNTSVNGFKTTKTTGVEVDLLQDSVERVLYNDNNEPSDVMRSFIRSRGLDINNPSDIKKVEEDYKNDIYLRTKRGKEEDVDTGAIVSNKRENRLSKESHATSGISFVETKQYGASPEASLNIYSFNSPYVIKGTSKSERPKTLYEIRYDVENGNIALLGKEYIGKDTTRTVEASQEEDLENPLETSNKKTTTTDTKNEDDWKDVVIKDRATVTSILSSVMGVNSYEDIVNKLKGDSDKLKEEKPKKTIKGF